MQTRAPSLWTPALIGGGVFGFLSAVPVVNMLNCLCCALIIGAGFLAGALYGNASKNAGMAFGAGEGAKVGALAGIVYAICSSVLGWLMAWIVPTADPKAVLEMMQSMGVEIPPEVLDMVEQFAAGGAPAWAVVVGFVFALAFGLVFATVGGLIAGAAFRYEPAPQAPPAGPAPGSGEPPVGTPQT